MKRKKAIKRLQKLHDEMSDPVLRAVIRLCIDEVRKA